MPLNSPNQSLRRAMRILHAVAGAEDGRTTAQIAERVEMKPNTVGRFIRTLEQERLLARRLGPLRFLLGPAIAELKHLDDTRHLLDVSGRVLVRMQVKMPQTNLVLVEAADGETYTRLQVLASRPGYLQSYQTKRHLPYDTASTMLILAYGTVADRVQFFRAHPFDEEGAKYWGTEQALHAFFNEVVRKGYAEPRNLDKWRHRLATPVFGPEGRLVAAVGAYMDWTNNPRLRNRLRELALKAAREITAGIA